MPIHRMTWHRRTRQRTLDAQCACHELHPRLAVVPAELAPTAARARRQIAALLPTLRELQLGFGPYVECDDEGPPDLAA
jgi:hypothetical protein